MVKLKAYEIALFLSIFVAMITFIQIPEVGLVEENVIYVPAWNNSYGESFNTTIFFDDVSGLEKLWNAGKFLVNATVLFGSALLYSTILLPLLLPQLGVPPELTIIITPIVWFVYGVGIFQMVTGRNVRLSE